MIRVYCAGPMSSSDPIQFMENLRKGQRLSTECLLEGYAIFSPFIDIALFMQLRSGEKIPVEMIQRQSMAWLEVSDAILLVPGWEKSRGTKAELIRSFELGIPAYRTIGDLAIGRQKRVTMDEIGHHLQPEREILEQQFASEGRA